MANFPIVLGDETDDTANDARIDRWHAGYFAQRRGEARPTDPDMADGWDDAANTVSVVVVMPDRPEGYFHAKLNGEF